MFRLQSFVLIYWVWEKDDVFYLNIVSLSKVNEISILKNDFKS